MNANRKRSAAFITAYQTSARIEPQQERDQSRRANLLLRTAHTHSWPPENKTPENVTSAVMVSESVCEFGSK